MKQTPCGKIVQALLQNLVLLNEVKLWMAYGPLYRIKNNKSLAATRLNNLAEQED